MTFVVPLDTVHSEAQILGAGALDAVRACIVGPHAHVVEKIYAGSYSPKGGQYKFPQLPEGTLLDPESIRVSLDARLEYFQHDEFRPVPGFPDRITSDIALSETPRWGKPAHPRHASLKGRNVQIGDAIEIRDGEEVFSTTVIGLASAPAVSEGPLEEPVDVIKMLETVRPTCTILLNRNLPQAFRDKEKLHVVLLMHRNNLELSRNKYASTEDRVIINPGLTVFDAQWYEGDKPAPLQVADAAVRISYRAWLSTYADKVYEAPDFDHVMKISGPNTPDNPLRYGVGLAQRNAGETPVDFIAVADPTNVSSWTAAFMKIKKSYGIVPLSSDPDVLAQARKFVRVRSKDENGRECVLWQTLKVPQNAQLAEETVSITKLPAGGFIAEAEHGEFMTHDIRSGDIVHIGDNECLIEAVMNEDTLLLAAQGELPAEAKITIWRKRVGSEYAHAIGTVAARIGDKRVRAVWPDRAYADGHQLPGYQLCAALAGLRSGVAPQQDLSSVELAGITNMEQALALFEEAELDMMAESGVWIVSDADGVAVTRNAVTTADPQNLAESNESVVTNLDTINKALRAQVAEIMTTVRATSAIQGILKATLQGRLQELMFNTILRVGPQLLEGEVTSLRRHVVLENNIVLSLRLVVPVAAGCGPKLGRLEIRQKLVA